MKEKCPNCGSEDIEEVKLFGSSYISCNNCGYDKSEELDLNADGKKKKSRNVYRTGGARRSTKRK